MNEFELFLFDLDGTLTESRSDLDEEMAELLENKKVAVISGAGFTQFKKQFIDKLPTNTNLNNLFIAPLTGGSLYKFDGNDWEKIYEDTLSDIEKNNIIKALEKAVAENNFLRPEKIFGKQIQDREGQITFSVLGDEAPLEIKKVWDPDIEKRKELKNILDKDLPEFEVSVGGSTSIDIRKKGIDKAYGIEKISFILKIPIEKIVFIGDAIFEGGNDYSAIKTGASTQKVSGPEETRTFLNKYLEKKY